MVPGIRLSVHAAYGVCVGLLLPGVVRVVRECAAIGYKKKMELSYLHWALLNCAGKKTNIKQAAEVHGASYAIAIKKPKNHSHCTYRFFPFDPLNHVFS